MSLYFLDSKENLTKNLIGGKGYYLHQMKQDDLPIPEAAFLSTELWQEYSKNKDKTIEKIKKELIPQMLEYFKKNNNGVLPLLSVRSAGAVSMPGMMDTILNVGVNLKYFKDMMGGEVPPKDDADTVATGKAKVSKTAKATKAPSKKKGKDADGAQGDISEEFMADVYARFLGMYGSTVLDMPKDKLPKGPFTKIADVEARFEDAYTKLGKTLPSQKPEEQLLNCITAVFDSWNNDRAKLYRKLNNIDDKAGTAVVVQRMVFGNKNDLSATGVLFSRNPSNGKREMTGEYLINAQGEDVVSGSHTPKDLVKMMVDDFESYKELEAISERLELKYKQVQDIEFTIEDGKVFILQARTAKCSPFAKLKMLMDMYKTRQISSDDVFESLTLQEYLDLNVKQVDEALHSSADGTGLPASMGALAGRIVFEASMKYEGEPTIFVAKETTPDDLEAIQLATGVLTASGGATSHAAVVARGMGKVCVVGCKDLKVDMEKGEAFLGGKKLKSGDWITMDANAGKVWVGNEVPIQDAQSNETFWALEDMVMEAHPEWTRLTSKVDEIVGGTKTMFMTYALDNVDEEVLEKELKDACEYLTGIMDLTGKLDMLQQKYPSQFLFANIAAEETFLRKKDTLVKLGLSAYNTDYDFELFLGPYEGKHGYELRQAGFKIRSSEDVAFEKPNDVASLVLTQALNSKIPKEKVAISSRNALLGILK